MQETQVQSLGCEDPLEEGMPTHSTPILGPYDAKTLLIGKDPEAEKDWGQEEKGMIEDEMVEWHHLLNGHEFE